MWRMVFCSRFWVINGQMRGMRNRMAHGYAFVNSVIIVKTIESNLPPVVDVLRAQLGEN